MSIQSKSWIESYPEVMGDLAKGSSFYYASHKFIEGMNKDFCVFIINVY